MFCQKCGQQVEDSALFCTHCGNKMAGGAPVQPPQAAQAAYAPYVQAPKKSKTGLIVGLCVGGAAVITAVVLLVVLLTGPSSDIAGTWYDVDGVAGTIDFKGGNTCTLKAMGLELDGNYTYDPQSGGGEITISFFGETSSSAFDIKDGTLHLEGTRYTKDKVKQQNLGDLFGDFSDFDMGSGDFDFGDFDLDDFNFSN